MVAMVINGKGKRMKEQDNDGDNDSLSHNKKKARRIVWSKDLHKKFVDAINILGEYDAVPGKIAAEMNVDGITSKHVASHLQKYRVDKKKAIHQADRVPSTMIPQPTQSQTSNINIHPSYNFPANQTSTLLLPNKNNVHQSHTQTYSPAGLNISGVAAPSTLTRPIQSQNINCNSLNIHPPPSTFPTHHQASTFPTQSQSIDIINNSFNIHPSHKFPVNQTSTSLLPNKIPLHQSDIVPNMQIYSPTAFNMSGVTPSTLIQRPTQSQNINHSSSIIHPPPSTFPIYHQHTSTFPTLVNQSTTPLGFPATTFDFHDVGTFVGSASSKSTSICDCDWYAKYMKRKPESLQFSHNSLPVLESDKTSQMNNSQQTHSVEPFIVGSASSLDDTDINSPIDFSVEETDPNTLEDIRNMGRYIEDEELINAWRCFQEEEATNVMQQPSC